MVQRTSFGLGRTYSLDSKYKLDRYPLNHGLLIQQLLSTLASYSMKIWLENQLLTLSAYLNWRDRKRFNCITRQGYMLIFYRWQKEQFNKKLMQLFLEGTSLNKNVNGSINIKNKKNKWTGMYFRWFKKHYRSQPLLSVIHH